MKRAINNLVFPESTAGKEYNERALVYIIAYLAQNLIQYVNEIPGEQYKICFDHNNDISFTLQNFNIFLGDDITREDVEKKDKPQEAINTVYELLLSSLKILKYNAVDSKAKIKDMLQLCAPQNIQKIMKDILPQENIPENKDTSLEELKIIIDYFADIGVCTANLVLRHNPDESVCDMLNRTKSNTLFSMCLVWYAYNKGNKKLSETEKTLCNNIKNFMYENCKPSWFDDHVSDTAFNVLLTQAYKIKKNIEDNIEYIIMNNVNNYNYKQKAFYNTYNKLFAYKQSTLITKNKTPNHPTKCKLMKDVVLKLPASTRISRVHLEESQNQQFQRDEKLSEENTKNTEPSSAAYKISVKANNNKGEKKAIIYFPGKDCSLHDMLLDCFDLAEKKQSDVYCIQYRNDNKIVTKNDIVDYADTLYSQVQKAGYSNIILYGQSLGGALATEVALKIQKKGKQNINERLQTQDHENLQAPHNEKLPLLVAEHAFANIITTVLINFPVMLFRAKVFRAKDIVYKWFLILLYVVAMASILIPLIAIFVIISSGIYLPTQKQFNEYDGPKCVLTASKDELMVWFKLRDPSNTLTFANSSHGTCDFKNNTKFGKSEDDELILEKKIKLAC